MKKTSIVLLLLALTLTACGGKPTPAPTAVPRQVTATAAIPTNPPNCEDSASFVADVTVPDNTPFEAGEPFTKVWRVRNDGSCAWTQGYALAFANGEEMDAPASIPLPYTPPNETADISVDLAAPAQKGAYVANFELHNADDHLIPIDNGKYLWTAIVVGEEAASEIPTSAGGVPTVTVTAAPIVGGPCAYTPNPDFVNQTLALINSQRAANGLPALSLNAQLSAAAQAHAADMACNSFLSHVGSDGSSAAARVAAAGYSASTALENIYGQPPQYGGTPESAVQWWMGDMLHRAVILNNKVTEIGVGYAFYDKSQLGGYWAVVFAAP